MQPSPTGSSGTEKALPPNEQDSASTTTSSTTTSSTNLRLKSTIRDANDISNDTLRASTLVSEVIQSAKNAADNALSWAEKKASTLDLEKENVGPYNSPATCMPSDLDVIANGVLPAMASKSQCDEDIEKQEKQSQNTKK